ncbi:peptidase A24 [Arcobacter sp. FW59]|nr:peptidase A24 [Arcobacter sp. FW59]
MLKKGKEDLEHYRSLKVLILSLVLSILLFIKFGFGLLFLQYSLFFYILVVLCSYDLKYKAVPDYLLLFVFITSFFLTSFEFLESLQNALFLSGAVFLLNVLVTFYIQNIKSRILKDESLKTKTALGEGDIPLIASIGVVLGLQEAIFTIFLSAILGIIHTIYVKAIKKESEIPFIPSLVIAFFLEFFFHISNHLKDLY